MKDLLRRLKVSLWAVFGVSPFLFGCSTGPVVSQVVFEDPARIVRVDVTYRTGKDEHSHPATVSVQELDQALQSILFEPSSLLPISFKAAGTDAQAFTQEEREFLSSHAVQALSRATPLEEVMFFWVHPRDNNIREVTSGSVYVYHDDLHVVLANFRQTTTNQGDMERAKDNPLEVLGQTLYYVEPGPGGRMAPESLWDKWFSQPRQHLIIPLNPVPSSAVDKDNTIIPIPKVLQENPPSLREKLEELQALRKEGLISEEEYQRKRKELLERF